MKMHMSGAMAHLEGDWTLSEMTFCNIDSLAASLEQVGSECKKNLRIDCRQIHEVDASGLQLLYIWLQCFRFWGVEPELVNLPDNLQTTFK